MYKETVVFLSLIYFVLSSMFTEKLFFLVTCFSANLRTPSQQNILYCNNSFQRTIKSNKIRRPNLPSANPASCLVASFEPETL